MNKKQLIYSVLGLTTLLIGVFVVLNISSPVKIEFNSEPFLRNARFFEPQSEDKVNFFNGYSFVSYDFNTDETTFLGDDVLRLPEVTDLRWSSSYVVFKAAGYSMEDELWPILQKERLPKNQNYWWFYSFNDKSISLLPGSENETHFLERSDSQLRYATNNQIDSTTTIYTHQIGEDSFNKTETISSDFDNLVFYSNGKFIAEKGGSVFVQDNDGVRNELQKGNIVYSSSEYSGESVAVFVKELDENALEHQHSEPEGTLYILNRDFDLIFEEHITTSDVVWNTSIDKYQYFNNDLTGVVNSEEDTIKQYEPNTEGELIEYSRFFKIDSGADVFIGSDINNNLYTNTDRLHSSTFSIKQLPLADDKNYFAGNYQIAYFPENNQYRVYIYKGNRDQIINSVFDYFKRNSVDPLQLEIKWYFEPL